MNKSTYLKFFFDTLLGPLDNFKTFLDFVGYFLSSKGQFGY